MENIYNQKYYSQYDLGDGKSTSYKDDEMLRQFFRNVAKSIVERFHPTTVLDAGCALGFLVEELQNLGVKAYGIDISEYAVSNVAPSVREYCAVCPLQEPFPKHFPEQFDLITNIEVMEHLSTEDCEKAINNLCSHTNRILFSSTSTDFDDPTHVNVNSIDYWAECFAKHGFYNCINAYPDYISKDAYCFEHSDNAALFVAMYERKILDYKKENNDLKNRNCILEDELEKSLSEVEEFKAKYSKTEQELLNVSAAYNEILFSHYWRATAPMRKVTHALKTFLRKYKITRYPCKAIKMLPKYGFVTTFTMAWHKLQKLKPFDYTRISKERREREENTVFPKKIKFSILVPLYNTPKNFLKEMIESVQQQTYSNWELCLADGSDAEHDYVGQFVQQCMKNDSRIVYKKLEKNMGISANTNACIEMATGNYIGLFDHDDYLHPSVLFENMKAICEHDADFVYTDEATFEADDISKIITFHFKPDYAIDNLRSNNYICHFSVFSRELLDKAGWFRSEFDGSQDHDIILRLTSAANRVYHIPKLLYFWRSHPNSVASDINSKTYAIKAGQTAVADSIAKNGIKCNVESSKAFPTIYRIKYELTAKPSVSIIIANKDHRKDLEKCINSILSKTTYDNYNIVIVENGSARADTFAYYGQLEQNEKISIVEYKDKFNYSAVNNLGVANADGEYIILLNNDTEIITPSWIEEMLMFAQRSDVGAVGAKLYYSDNTIQHAGIVLGLGKHRIAGHSHYGLPKEHLGYMGKLYYAQNVSAVTGACMMFRKNVFEQVGGLDTALSVAFNDVDFCLKLREKGYLIVLNPYAELYHFESKSRGLEDTKEKKERFEREVNIFRQKWDRSVLENDPYYNPNFSLDTDYKVLFEKLQTECCK